MLQNRISSPRVCKLIFFFMGGGAPLDNLIFRANGPRQYVLILFFLYIYSVAFYFFDLYIIIAYPGPIMRFKIEAPTVNETQSAIILTGEVFFLFFFSIFRFFAGVILYNKMWIFFLIYQFSFSYRQKTPYARFRKCKQSIFTNPLNLFHFSQRTNVIYYIAVKNHKKCRNVVRIKIRYVFVVYFTCDVNS